MHVFRYSVSKAEQRLRAHATWRQEYVPLGRIQEVRAAMTIKLCCYTWHSCCCLTLHDTMQSEIQPELDADKTFLQGCDKLGRPLTICVINKHSKSKRKLEQTKRYIAYSLDNSIHAVDLKTNPTGKTCAIFDLRGAHHVVPADPPHYWHPKRASFSAPIPTCACRLDL